MIPAFLLFEPVHALPSIVLRRRDLDPALLAGSGEKPTDAVRLPVRRLHDLRQGRTLGSADQFQDLGTLALGTRCLRFLLGGGLRRLVRLGRFLGGGGLGSLALFLPLGAFFSLFEAAFVGATGAPCSATAAVSEVLASNFGGGQDVVSKPTIAASQDAREANLLALDSRRCPSENKLSGHFGGPDRRRASNVDRA